MNKTQRKEQRYLQLGIEGIADNVEVSDFLGFAPKRILRVRLAHYIRESCMTNKVGFAAIVGVSPATITKWLYTDTMPSMQIVQKFARRTGLTVDEVLDFFDEGVSS